MQLFKCTLLLLILVSQISRAQQHHEEPVIFSLHIKIFELKDALTTHIDYQVKGYRLHYDHNISATSGLGDFDENEHKKFAHREQRELFQFLEKATALKPDKKLDLTKEDAESEMKITMEYLKDGQSIKWEAWGEKNTLEKTDAYKQIVALEELIAMMCHIPAILSE